MSKPDRSLVWNNYQGWRKKVLKCLPNYLNSLTFEAIKDRPPRHFVSDDLTYVEDAIARTLGERVDIKRLLAESLTREFDFMRAFHGCRPATLDGYKEVGIIPSSLEGLERTALSVFGDSQRVRDALASLQTGDSPYTSYNTGKVFFCLTLEEFLRDCGHYLLYGSEYLLCVANTIGAAGVLRARGKATAIECDVPMTDIPTDFLRDLCGMFIATIVERYCIRRTSYDGDGGFYITKALPPERIVAFHHPTKIPNPHNLMNPED